MCDGTQEPDETSLLQVDHLVKPGHKRRIDVEHKAAESGKEQVRKGSENHEMKIKFDRDAELLDHQKAFFAHSKKIQEILKRQEQAKHSSNDEPKKKIWPLHHKSKKHHTKKAAEMASQQTVAYTMPAQQAAGSLAGYGASSYQYPAPGLGSMAAAYGPDTFTNSVTYNVQVAPGAAMEDPKRAAARAAKTEELAERAMENAVWKSQQHERAAVFAAKRSDASMMASERAANMEKAAARASVDAADSVQNHAIMQAAAQRTHARLGAYKAAVQRWTANQAVSDMAFSAQKAESARAATAAGIEGLHSMQEDLRANDMIFNDRDPSRFARHRYLNAMDDIAYNRMDFSAEDAPMQAGAAAPMQAGAAGTASVMFPGQSAEAGMAAAAKMGADDAGFASLGSSMESPMAFGAAGGQVAGQATGTCREFQCGYGFWKTRSAARSHCGAGGCTQQSCCKQATHCGGFRCGVGFLKLHRANHIRCPPGQPCALDQCCHALPCKEGDPVLVGEGDQYPATISKLNLQDGGVSLVYHHDQSQDFGREHGLQR
jgi:hypothetical protein